MLMKLHQHTVIGFFMMASLSLRPTIMQAQAISGAQVASAVGPEFAPHSSILIIPTVNNRLALSRSATAMVEDTAASLRASGFTVRTLQEGIVESQALRAIGRAGAVESGGIGRMASGLGVAAVLVLGLVEFARENEMTVTASIYSSTGGMYEEIWKSKVGWREKAPAPPVRTATAGACSMNLIANGDFSHDWPVGWRRSYGGSGGNLTEVVNTAEGNMLHLKHTGQSEVALFQIVPVAGGRLFFQFEGRFHTWEGPVAAFSGTGIAGITIELMDAYKNTLGKVWAGSYVRNLFEGTGLAGVPHGPRDTPSAVFLTAPNEQTVRERFDLTRFVHDRLMSTDPARIRYIGVNISAGATHPSAGAELWVNNLILEQCP